MLLALDAARSPASLLPVEVALAILKHLSLEARASPAASLNLSHESRLLLLTLCLLALDLGIPAADLALEPRLNIRLLILARELAAFLLRLCDPASARAAPAARALSPEFLLALSDFSA